MIEPQRLAQHDLRQAQHRHQFPVFCDEPPVPAVAHQQEGCEHQHRDRRLPEYQRYRRNTQVDRAADDRVAGNKQHGERDQHIKRPDMMPDKILAPLSIDRQAPGQSRMRRDG